MVGTTSLYGATKDGFRIYLIGWAQSESYPDSGVKPSADTANYYNWNINWSAFGYTCKLTSDPV